MSDEISREVAQRWRQKFGDRGLAYLLDGKTWDEAVEAEHASHVAGLEGRLSDQASAFDAERKQFAETLAAKDAQIAELTSKLSAAAAVATTPDVIPIKPSRVEGEKKSVFGQLRNQKAA
jgi:hypothetical protein